jgi:hypothetical protein
MTPLFVVIHILFALWNAVGLFFAAHYFGKRDGPFHQLFVFEHRYDYLVVLFSGPLIWIMAFGTSVAATFGKVSSKLVNKANKEVKK